MDPAFAVGPGAIVLLVAPSEAEALAFAADFLILIHCCWWRAVSCEDRPTPCSGSPGPPWRATNSSCPSYSLTGIKRVTNVSSSDGRKSSGLMPSERATVTVPAPMASSDSRRYRGFRPMAISGPV